MRPSHLALGNWVQILDLRTGEYRYGTIESIQEFDQLAKLKVYDCTNMPYLGTQTGYLKPIPLTELFIQKNFQPHYKDIYELTTLWGIRPFHDHWQVCLLTMDEFGGGSWEGAFEVRYVHEVQQFLRLLKVEKEVVV